MDSETRELIKLRLEQVCRGVPEAIRREVEWLERHNFPIWVSENGRIVDASKKGSSKELDK